MSALDNSIKKLRVPARHSLTPVTHRPLTHTKRAPQHRVRHMRRATITKQRIHKNRRLIITTTRHVTSGSRYALTRSLHTVNKLAKERPHAPQRPGTRATAVSYRHRLQNPLSRPIATLSMPPHTRQPVALTRARNQVRARAAMCQLSYTQK